MYWHKKLLAIFFAFFLVSLVSTKVLAATDLNLPNTLINPDKYLFYSIKRAIEKGILFIKFSKDSKVNYYTDLMSKRLAELKYVVENELGSEVEKSTQRLSYQVGILSDYIAANKELEQKAKPTVDLLTKYKQLLQELRDYYPANSPFRMLVQHTINSIDLNIEKLK